MENNVTDILVCQCSSTEHQLIIRYENIFESEPEVYVSVYLTKHGFWKRVKIAFKYIFGYKCRYGQWDEVILGPEHTEKLQHVVNLLKRK